MAAPAASAVENPPNAVELFKTRQDACQCTVLIFYRGERSFFCKHWLRRWLAIPALRRRLDLTDVALLFVSSQSQGKAFCVADQLAVSSVLLDKRIFFFGDPEHLLVSHLAGCGLPHPVITNPDLHRAHGWVFDFGMVQPAVIAVAPELNVLYAWTSKPSLLNVAGKLDRPDPFDVWDCIEHRLDRIRITKAREERKKRSLVAESSAASSAAQQPLALPAPEPSIADGTKEYVARDPDASVRSVIPTVNFSVEDPKNVAVNIDVASRASKFETEGAVTNDRALLSGRSIAREEDRQASLVSVSDGPGPSPVEIESLSTMTRLAESEGITAPLSTTIESLANEGYPQKTLTQEEPDVSDGDIASTPVKHDVSSNINALACEVLKENTLSLNEEMKVSTTPMATTVSRRIAELENKSAKAGLDEFANEFAGLHDKALVTEPKDDDLETREASESEPDAATETVHDEHSPTKDPESEPEDDTHVMDDVPPIMEKDTAIADIMDDDPPTMEKDTAIADIMDDDPPTMEKDTAIADIIDDAATSESSGAERSDDQLGEDDFIGSTQSTRESRSVVDPLTPSPLSASLASGPPLCEDCNEANDANNVDDASFASIGSAQADASLAANKFSSVRTEDSAHVNTLHCSSEALEADRYIPEEADDTKMGISDYLRELQDPERQHYVVRGSRLLHVTSKGVVMTAAGEVAEMEGNKRGASLEWVEVDMNEGEALTERPVAVAKTDSPHPELHLATARIIDVSPFADADGTFDEPGIKAGLRDEYEAYDEYVVCEFEVEEFVEEFESETWSGSKGLTPGSERENTNGGEEGGGQDGEGSVAGGGTGGGAVGVVRKVWRRMAVPVRVYRRRKGEDEGERVGRKETLRGVFGKRKEEEDDEMTARLGRKETLRSVLRKFPGRKREEIGEIGEEEDKKTGLQAVLQRLPSLSGGNRRVVTCVAGETESVEVVDESRREDREVEGAVRGEEAKKRRFTRTLSRLRASGVEDEEGRVQWHETGEEGEKVVGKRSLVGMGGKLLGKLRMS